MAIWRKDMAMLRRMLLALLTLCLALPAAAMPLAPVAAGNSPAAHHAAAPSCHEQQAPTDHGKQQAPKRTHDCIGCIAPLCRLPIMPDAPALRSAPYIPTLAWALSGSARAPETPPPRA